jgi:alpha-tubulin suppressor-like RCC1 family protein
LSGKTIKSISVNGADTCAIASDNLAYCWGNNVDGELGNNSITQSNIPVAVYTGGVLSGKTIQSISVSSNAMRSTADSVNTCVIASDNQAYCWGVGTSGQLGNNAAANSSVPVAVYTGGVLSGKTIKPPFYIIYPYSF